MQPERISVALCTYNGERYLRTQLDSIRDQTRKPDELVISDDGSTDATLSIVADFSKTVSFPVHVYRQETRKGSTKNFEFAIGKCTGDIICLADQDDKWLPEKLEIIERTFQSDRDIGWFFSDGYIVDENLEITGERLWDRVQFTRRERQRFEKDPTMVLLRHNVVTGAAMAFRARYVSLVCPIPPEWVHDAWIAILLSLKVKGALVTEPTFFYRQHQKQQLGAGKQTLMYKIRKTSDYSYPYFESQAKNYKDLESWFVEHRISGIEFELLKNKITHLEARSWIIQKKGGWIITWIYEILSGRYFIYSAGATSIMRDFLLD